MKEENLCKHINVHSVIGGVIIVADFTGARKETDQLEWQESGSTKE